MYSIYIYIQLYSLLKWCPQIIHLGCSTKETIDVGDPPFMETHILYIYIYIYMYMINSILKIVLHHIYIINSIL